MKCQLEYIGPAGDKHQHRCKVCKHVVTATEPNPALVHRNCGKKGQAMLQPAEAQELFGESDPTLWGNKLAALTTAIGIPPCGGCEKRKAWLNAAHAWLRSTAATVGRA